MKCPRRLIKQLSIGPERGEGSARKRQGYIKESDQEVVLSKGMLSHGTRSIMTNIAVNICPNCLLELVLPPAGLERRTLVSDLHKAIIAWTVKTFESG